MICNFDRTSNNVLVTITCDIPNKEGIFLYNLMILKPFFHFYLLNMDISLNIKVTCIKSLTQVNNTHVQGTVSQNFHLGLSFYLMLRNG